MKADIDSVSAIGGVPKADIEPQDKTCGIGAVLRELRKRKRKTQAEIADCVGLERTSIVNIEAGNQALSVRHLELFAEALNLDVQITFKDKK